MFYILSIEITYGNLSIAISLNKDIIAYDQSFISNNQSDIIVNMIEKCLNQARIHYHDLQYVAVTNGPSSFTSTRIGLSAASAIVTATNAKGVSVSYFDLLFYRAHKQIKDINHFICIIQAKRSSFYIKEFVIDDFGHISSTEPQEITHDQFKRKISSLKTQTVCLGNGVNNDFMLNKNIIILPRLKIVRAMYLCDYVYHKIAHEPQALNETLEPIYIKSCQEL